MVIRVSIIRTSCYADNVLTVVDEEEAEDDDVDVACVDNDDVL